MMQPVIEYIYQFDPEFPNRIKGASPSEILALEQLVGVPLPQAYKNFLLYMGHNDGGLELTFDGTTCITSIIDFYEELVNPGDIKLPAGCLVIGLSAYESEEQYVLDWGISQEKIYVCNEDRIRFLYASSLENLLYRIAFTKYRMSACVHSLLLSTLSSEWRFVEAQQFAVEQGVHKLWFSDQVRFYGEKKGVILTINQSEDQGLNVYIKSNSLDSIIQLSRVFKNKFHLIEYWL